MYRIKRDLKIRNYETLLIQKIIQQETKILSTRMIPDLYLILVNSSNVWIFFVTPPPLRSGRNAVRRTFLLGKLIETLGRIDIEDLENTGKRAREKKKDNRFNRRAQMQMSSATLVCTL